MSSASKGKPMFVGLQVGEIFTAAGTAFTKLGELTMQLHTNSVGGSSKWTEEDIESIHHCLTKFANDIDEITSRVKLRTMANLSASIRKRELEEIAYNPAPLSSPPVLHLLPPPPPVPVSSHGGHIKGSSKRTGKKLPMIHHHAPLPHLLGPIGEAIPTVHSSQEVTLNMLNATDGDLDLKVDFDIPPSSS